MNYNNPCATILNLNYFIAFKGNILKLYTAFRLAAEKMQSVDPLTCPTNEKYICLTLDFHPEIPTKTAKNAKEIIRERLGGKYFTYGSWINKYHPELRESCKSFAEEDTKLHQGRIAWLWSLHEEFKKKQK